MKQVERPRLRRWSRGEYARLIDHGILDEVDPVELLDGLLLVKEPQHSPRRTAVLLTAKDRVLEVHREPRRSSRRHRGYASIVMRGSDGVVSPLTAAAVSICVPHLLP